MTNPDGQDPCRSHLPSKDAPDLTCIFAIFCLVLLVCLVLCFFRAACASAALDNIKAEAARRGHAEFRLEKDQVTPTWRWKDVPPEARP